MPRTPDLRQYDTLDRPPREDLVSVAELAASICGTPMASVNLITGGVHHQVATVGMDPGVCRLEDSMCGAVLKDDPPVLVSNTLEDPRFAQNPFVNGQLGAIRFYASHRITAPGGATIGTLCVFDLEPRTLDGRQLTALGTLADRVVDVLELSARNHQLETVSTRLRESNERLAAFAGQISHDLRTPLTGISMALELLDEELEQHPSSTNAGRLVARAHSSAGRMGALLADVLRFATLGGGLDTAPVDLGALLDEVLADLEPLGDAVVEHGALPTVPADAAQLRAVLQNLVGNALKYRHPDRPPRVCVTAHRDGSDVRLEVADNGRGVPAGQTDRVFEPLARADASVAGHGIGLATCRRIVEAHGGSIGLDSVEGEGTTVWVRLPAS
ncbi:GAF domain-containing sensor histidine kinase [Nocardioides sp. SOB77]|uniref:Sensor-like histidine kinase SenX3 n=1 Tax=Nocardioides oceani TaxID=3058369 RepID=A0ABT8FE69_9ACTN|nr:GAF domain-containing sensor histidine kinase [Nocardioides oceani]MDN4172712.1 GAF domain-containing sensor histidine kinase [Nocardioides oceani]